jgi:crotonobetainyl-CoA:carnitine CoA-transferase CaiB-like acyl-CoA transferase
MTGPLAGLKILDFTQALAGPFCTQNLADLGAEVVKVEGLDGGDLSRRSGPFHEADPEHRFSGYFQSINRGKKSIAVDLKAPEGVELVKTLIPQFDVVVENFRVGVMDRLGLSYETLAALNPKLVYAAIRGFGDPRTGQSPYVEWPAYDVVAQAMGGMMGVTGLAAGQPIKIGPGVGDTVPALYLALGIVSAVLHARATGEGQFLDVAMADAVLGVSERIVHQYSFGHQVPGPEGNHHPFLLPFGIYPAADGFVALACPSEAFFRALCVALGAPEILDEPEFATSKARAANRSAVRRALRPGAEHRRDRPRRPFRRPRHAGAHRAPRFSRADARRRPADQVRRYPGRRHPPRPRAGRRHNRSAAPARRDGRRHRALALGRRDPKGLTHDPTPHAPSPLAALGARRQ